MNKNQIHQSTKELLDIDRCNRYLFFAKGVLPLEPTFVDIGSRSGIHAIALLKKFKSKIIVYEADKENYLFLRQAISKSTIIAHRIAVTGKDGKTDFFIFSSASSNSIYPRHIQEIGPNKTNMRLIKQAKVQSSSVESVITRDGLQYIDVLFCNCEGAELGILEEVLAKAKLRDRIGQLCISFHGGRIYPQTQTINMIEKMSKFFLVITEQNDWPCHLFINKNIVK